MIKSSKPVVNSYHQRYLPIITILAEFPGLNIEEIYVKISYTLSISKAHVYKVTHYMTINHMLLRKGKQLFIHRSWVVDFFKLADTVNKNYLHSKEINSLSQGERIVFFENSFYGLDSLWLDILLGIFLHEGAQPFYYYNSHPYFIADLYETELNILKKLVGSNQIFGIFGNRTKIAESIVKQKITDGESCLIIEDIELLQQGFCLNVYGDYVFEYLLPSDLQEEFDNLFLQAPKMNEHIITKINEFIHIKTKHKLTIYFDKKKADNYRTIFDKFYS